MELLVAYLLGGATVVVWQNRESLTAWVNYVRSYLRH